MVRFLSDVEDLLELKKEYTYAYLVIILVLSFFPSLIKMTPHPILSSYTNILLNISALLCLLLSWRILKVHRETEFKKIGIFFVAYFALWFCGELTWSLYDIIVGKTSVPNLADLFWLLGYMPLFYIFSFTINSYRKYASTSEIRKIIIIWALLFLPSVGYLIFTTAFSPAGFLSKFVNSLYPLFDSILILILFILLLMYRNAKLETYWLIITAGMLANAVGDLLFLYYDAFGIYEVGSLPDNFFIFSYLIIAFGFFRILKGKIMYFKTTPLPERGDDSVPRYVVERGRLYLFKEAEPHKSFEVFCDLVTHGTSGLCIGRSYPEKVRKRWGLEKTSVMWFSNSEARDSISPQDLNKLIYIISEFLKKTRDSAVFLEGVEYLMVENDFLLVLKTLHTISDLIVMHDSRLIVSLNPKALGERETALLEKEMNVYQER